MPGKVQGVSGVNLPMLIKSLTYREHPMDVLIEKAMAGAQEGVIRMAVGAKC